MRHRAPRPLVRLLQAAPARRGIAAGSVLLLGASSGVYLLTADDATPGPGSRTVADPPVGERDGTSYPDAAALENLSAARVPTPSRGQARTRPSEAVSTSATPTPEHAAPTTPTPTPAQPQPTQTESADPGRAGSRAGSSTPTPSDPPQAGSSPAPSSPPPSSTAPAPSPTGPDTAAATQVAAGGTWTVALSSAGTLTSFQCSLDGAAYTPCGPVATFTGLSKGRHTLSARAVDGAGTADPSPVVVTTNVTGSLL